MGKYDFIKKGNVLFWHDPDNGQSDGVYQVVSVPEVIEDDSIILIAASCSEAEVYPTELSPINSGRSYTVGNLSLVNRMSTDIKKGHYDLSALYHFHRNAFLPVLQNGSTVFLL